MKYLKKFNESNSDEELFNKYIKYISGTYTIDEDGYVNVVGNVSLAYKKLTEIPIKFGTVTGAFDCSNNYLTTLKNAPKKVGKFFDCGDNKLTSIIGCPDTKDWISFNNNHIKNLEGCPERLSGFYINNNHLTNLIGGPSYVEKDYECMKNFITTIEDGPSFVGDTFDFGDNEITSLRGLPEDIKRFSCHGNPIFKYWAQVPNDDLLEVFLYMDIDTNDGKEICDEKLAYILESYKK